MNISLIKVSKHVFNENAVLVSAYYLPSKMLAALEKNVESFTHPTVPPIFGQPSYEKISEIQLKINTDAASIYSHKGDGRLGLLYLRLKLAVYTHCTYKITTTENRWNFSNMTESAWTWSQNK